jgi:hypothetical protein
MIVVAVIIWLAIGAVNLRLLALLLVAGAWPRSA